MTGLRPKQDAVLEVGLLRVREDREVNALQFFVDSGRQITPDIQALTGISQEMAKTGVTLREAVYMVEKFVGNDIWVGHNVIFDYSFLKQLAVNEKLPFEKQAFDTLKLARRLMKEPEGKSLEELCGYLKIPREHGHRALADARAAHLLFQWLYKNYGEKEPELFAPKPLLYRPKRQTPATKTQKIYLKELADYHKINLDVSLETLTRSEASRLTDRLIAAYGRMPGRRGGTDR